MHFPVGVAHHVAIVELLAQRRVEHGGRVAVDQAGAVEFISKPFSPLRLIERMRVTIAPESNAI